MTLDRLKAKRGFEAVAGNEALVTVRFERGDDIVASGFELLFVANPGLSQVRPHNKELSYVSLNKVSNPRRAVALNHVVRRLTSNTTLEEGSCQSDASIANGYCDVVVMVTELVLGERQPELVAAFVELAVACDRADDDVSADRCSVEIDRAVFAEIGETAECVLENSPVPDRDDDDLGCTYRIG